MSLTRDFRETIKARAERDPAFREELLREGAECLLSGDLETGKAVLKAARIGIADIEEGRFRSFDAPEPLRRHLSTLAEDAISDSGAAETQGWRIAPLYRVSGESEPFLIDALRLFATRWICPVTLEGAGRNLGMRTHGKRGGGVMNSRVRHLAAMLAPALLAACMVAAPARAAGVSCEAWNTRGFFERAAAAEVSRCLKTEAKVNARNKAGLTPLHWAAELSKTPAVVKALLVKGAQVNARTTSGEAPLHIAANRETPAVVKTLLAAEAKVNARDEKGRTSLHHAARFSENVEVVKTLLAAGAESAARDNAGKTPWHYAEENDALKGTEVYWRLNDGRFR